MEDVAAYAVHWKDSFSAENVENRLLHASRHLSIDLRKNRDRVESNTQAKGEITSAITSIERERNAYGYEGDDASQYFPYAEVS